MGSSGPSGEILEKCLQEALKAGWQVSSETWDLALFLSLSEPHFTCLENKECELNL